MAHPLLFDDPRAETVAGKGSMDAKLGLAPHGVFANPMRASIANPGLLINRNS